MEHIIGSFNREDAARAAFDRFAAAGFDRSRLHVQAGPVERFLEAAGPTGSRAGDPDYRQHGFAQSIGDMFANLIESHTDESGIYSEALGRGDTLLVIAAQDASEAQRARALLDECGGVPLTGGQR